MLDLRSDSTTSRFSSPGTAKMRSTPSFSSALTNSSDAFIEVSWVEEESGRPMYRETWRVELGSQHRATDRFGAVQGLALGAAKRHVGQRCASTAAQHDLRLGLVVK